MRPATIAAIILLIALCEAVFGQESIDLRSNGWKYMPTWGGSISGATAELSDLPSGSSVEMAIKVGYATCCEGLSIGSATIEVTRSYPWSPATDFDVTIRRDGDLITLLGSRVEEVTREVSDDISMGWYRNHSDQTKASVIRSATYWPPVSIPIPEPTTLPDSGGDEIVEPTGPTHLWFNPPNTNGEFEFHFETLVDQWTIIYRKKDGE